MRGAAHAAAFIVGTIAVLQAHLALGPERVADGAVGVPIVVLAVGCIVSFLAWGSMSHWSAYHVRELIGTGFVIAGLFSVMAFWDADRPQRIEGWQWVTFTIAFFAFFLHSQQSFMMFAVVFASLMLVGQSFAPAATTALAFVLGTCVLMAALAHREKAERFPMGARAFGVRPPLRATAPVLAALATLFGVFYAVKPPAVAVTAEDWIRWLREGPPPADALGGGDLDLDPGAPKLERNPMTGAGADAPAGPVTIGFDHDLKFGDLPGAPSEAIAMYVSVRDAGGEPVDRRDLRAYWATAAVTDYDGRGWSGDPEEPARLDGANGRTIVSAGRGERLEQRFILSPLQDRSLFALYPVEWIGFDSVGIDRERMLSRIDRYVTWFKYSATSIRTRDPNDRSTASHPESRYLSVPASVRQDRTFRSIVSRSKAGRSDLERIGIVEAILKRYTYTLKPGFPADVDPTLEFLKRQRGYCQHFASAMALVLRELGIPTRIVLGYAGGDWDYEGSFHVVRRRHAHAWVEVHFNGIGWAIFDPAAGPAETYREAEPDTPTPDNPAPDNPTPDNPTPDNPTPDNPTPDNPTPDNPTPDNPAPDNPAPDNPAPDNPAPDNPAPDNPAPDIPTPERPTPDNPTPAQPVLPTPERPDPARRFNDMWEGVQNATIVPAVAGSADAPPPPTGSAAIGTNPVRSSLEFLAGSVLRDLAAIAIAAIVLVALVRIRTRRRRPAGLAPAPETEAAAAPPTRYRVRGTSEFEIVRIYLRMVAALGPRDSAETANEFAARHPGDAVASLTSLFVRARYGPEPLGDDDTRHARRLLGEIVR